MDDVFINDAQTTDNRVLVVDDDHFLCELLNRYLSQLGYCVYAVETGDEALAIASKEHLQIALVDIVLSGMSGIELVDQLKELNPEMIVIMMTGHPSLESALQALKKGVQDYLIKPFKLEQLDKVIKKCLEEKRIILENRHLKQELEAVKERLNQYERFVRQPHMVNLPVVDEKSAIRLPRGDAVYRGQSLHSKETALQNRLNKLILLREEGVISEDEFEARRKQLSLNDGTE